MKDFQLRGSIPKTSRINRSLLIIIFTILLILLASVLFVALQSSSDANKNHLDQNSSAYSGSTGTSPLLKELPQNYQDVNGIKKYFRPDETLPPAVAEELNKLRAEEAAMQAQMAQLKDSQNSSSAQGKEAAIHSDLFFSAAHPANNLFDQSNNKNNSNNSFLNNMNSTNNYIQENMQGQKSSFLQNVPNQGDVYNQFKMIQPASPYEVQAGTIIAANLLTGINTSLPGDVVAQVRQDVYDTVHGKYLLIPKGSKLLGKYDSSIAYGQERVLIAFDRIIRPDGTSIQLSNFTGSDEKGTSGFAADVNNHWSRILGAATISSLLSFGAAASAGSNNNNYYPNVAENSRYGAANSIAQTGQTITNRAIDIQPTLTVPTGFNFNVIVNKDMVLKPYAEKTL